MAYTYFITGEIDSKPFRIFTSGVNPQEPLRYLKFAGENVRIDEVSCVCRGHKLSLELADRFLKGV